MVDLQDAWIRLTADDTTATQKVDYSKFLDPPVPIVCFVVQSYLSSTDDVLCVFEGHAVRLRIRLYATLALTTDVGLTTSFYPS